MDQRRGLWVPGQHTFAVGNNPSVVLRIPGNPNIYRQEEFTNSKYQNRGRWVGHNQGRIWIRGPQNHGQWEGTTRGRTVMRPYGNRELMQGNTWTETRIPRVRDLKGNRQGPVKRLQVAQEREHKQMGTQVDRKTREQRNEFLRYRRKINYGAGKTAKSHPNVNDVVDFQLQTCHTNLKGQNMEWTPNVQTAKVVDTETTFKAMVDLLRPVPVISMGIETTCVDVYKEYTVLIKLGTPVFTFLIDTKALPCVVEEKLSGVLRDKVLVMFDSDDDIRRLKLDFGIFSNSVFDLAKFVQMKEWRQGDTHKDLTFTRVMQRMLGTEYSIQSCEMKEVFSTGTDWGRRPISDIHIHCAASDVYYMMRLWFILVNKYPMEELQRYGIEPNIEQVGLKVINTDVAGSFEDDLKLLQQSLQPEDQSSLGQMTPQLFWLWEHRKLVAMIHNKPADLIISLGSLRKLIMASPKNTVDLEQLLRSEVATCANGQIVFRHSREMLKILEGGKKAWDAILFRVCHTCLNPGHIGQNCWMKSTAETKSQYLSIFHPTNNPGPKKTYAQPEDFDFDYGIQSARDLYGRSKGKGAGEQNVTAGSSANKFSQQCTGGSTLLHAEVVDNEVLSALDLPEYTDCEDEDMDITER